MYIKLCLPYVKLDHSTLLPSNLVETKQEYIKQDDTRTLAFKNNLCNLESKGRIIRPNNRTFPQIQLNEAMTHQTEEEPMIREHRPMKQSMRLGTQRNTLAEEELDLITVHPSRFAWAPDKLAIHVVLVPLFDIVRNLLCKGI